MYKNPRLVCVFESEEQCVHWMNDRVFKRASLQFKDYECLVWDSNILGKLETGPWTTVLAFGEEVLQNLLHKSTNIVRWSNRVVSLALNKKTLWVIPSIEPSALLNRKGDDSGGLRNPPRYTGHVIATIRKAIRVSEEGFTFKPLEYHKDPSPTAFHQLVGEWFDAGFDMLSWDIETNYKMKQEDESELEERERRKDTKVIRISFAVKCGQAVSIPFLPEYHDDIRRLLAFGGTHVGWNIVGFDVPELEKLLFEIRGKVWDGMDAWHLYQPDQDKGLEYVTGYYTDLLPWKHLSASDPALYSCIDADAALRNMLGVLADLQSVNLFDRFLKEMQVSQVLTRAGGRGNCVNDTFRLELKQEYEALLFTELMAAQAMVKPELHRHKLYQRIPKDALPEEWDSVEKNRLVTMCSQCGKPRVSTKHKCPDAPDGNWEKRKVLTPVPHFFKKAPLEGVASLSELLGVLKNAGFNPSSSLQMKRYMKWHKHPVGKNHKTDKESADTKHLQRLHKKYGTGHPIYAQTVKIHKIQKALSTYVDGLAPDSFGYVYTSYVNSPSTWRIGSRNINVQNLGKSPNNPYAARARAIIVPRPGNLFVQADSSAIEAVFVGHFMNDPLYIEKARKGIHAFIACKKLGLPPTDENRALMKTKKYKSLYDKTKRGIHATNYGMGPYLLHMNEPEDFPTLASAKEMQRFIYAELPGLEQWHKEIRVFAQKHGYLDNPWNLRHPFYDVFTYKYDEDGRLERDDDGNPIVKLGGDSKRVIALKPQSSAGMFMRDNVLLMEEAGLGPYMTPILSIHDGYTLDCPPDKADWAQKILVAILTRPIMELGGLRVGCEVERSKTREAGGNFLDLTLVEKVEIQGNTVVSTFV